MTILHITCDYPDAVQPRKTRAIANLVEGSTSLQHRVISLNRVSLRGGGAVLAPGRMERVADDGSVETWTYTAPPGGLFLHTALRVVAHRIADEVLQSRLRPRLIHAHKLTIEGTIGAAVAARLGIPYVLSLQGNTDRRVMRFRPDLAAHFGRVFKGAAAVFPFSPWIYDFCVSRYGTRPTPPVYLPCITSTDRIFAPRIAGPKVVSAFHLEHYRLKNLGRLVRGTALAAASISGLELELAGGGPPTAEAAADRELAAAGPARARRVGSLTAEQIQPWMNGAGVFLLPSLRESFGMVFLEALFSGCPIIYPQGTAVDGYFPGKSFAAAVPARDTRAIGDAVTAAIREEAERKAELKEWQQSEEAEWFKRDAILGRYTAAVKQIPQLS